MVTAYQAASVYAQQLSDEEDTEGEGIDDGADEMLDEDEDVEEEEDEKE